MNRRDLLKLGALAPIGLGGRQSKGKEKEEILLLNTVVAGFQYYEGERVWDRMKVGDPLELRREPDNPYDDMAVEIYWKGEKIGYVPRSDNTAVAQLMDRDMTLRAEIESLEDSLNPWDRVGVKIYLKI